MRAAAATRLRTDPATRAAEKLGAARRVTVITGAGVSAASGIPTFRGAGGLWKNHRPESLATAAAFARDPVTVWEWYAWRRQRIAEATPNAAHAVLARWSQRFEAFTLVTQNVDGLHEQAGTKNVVRFHGSIWRLRCTRRCGAPEWEDRNAAQRTLPRCETCGAVARPGVVWFGEEIPSEAVQAAFDALDCDVCLVAGTSSVVTPAAGLVGEARRRGAYAIEINPEATPVTGGVDLAIAGRAEEVLVEIEKRLSVKG
ncbi:MAG: NAD-dependent deacylase [Acidobacteria bacterium]|nr:NAD-dependent deacylase [Acidobacteriota bacterium]MCA1611041.1 NAD-dependent deacylase [Acidobacteriota bacterium]